jgi:uncharacterized protein
MNNSESGSERNSGNEPSGKISPPVEAETTQIEVAEKEEKSADRLPRWGVGTAKQRLMSFGMVLAYAVIFYLLFRIVGLLLIGTRSLPPQIRSTLGEVLAALCAIGATLIAAKLERRKFSSYGFGDRLAAPRFLWASLWGFVALTVFLLGLRVTQHYYFGAPGIHGAEIIKFGFFYLVLFLAVAVFEESLMRGYALFKLSEAIGFWPAVILLSILFGSGHITNKGESTFGVVAAGLFGVVIAYSILRSGSLWWAIGFHFMWDYSESFIYGVPDSGFVAPGHLLNSSFNGPAWITGGTVGPEGSYFILLVLAALAAVIHMTLPRQDQVISPQKHREPKFGDTEIL